MRIYTTALLLTCTVLLTTAFEALALPTFTITNIKHACGGQMNGSFTIRVTAANPGSLRIRVIGVAPFVDINDLITPTPGLPFDYVVNNVPGADGGGAQNYVVIVSDPANRTDFVDIYDFQASLESIVDNTDPGCSAPTGQINIKLDGMSPSAPISYTWTGPGGPYFTQDLANIAGGDYSLSYSDGTTTCTLGPFHVNDPAATPFTISSPDPTICFGEAAQVDISATDAVYSYRVLEGATVVGAATPGTGGAISINVPGLAVGSHTLRVEASAGTCPPKFNNAPDLTITVAPVPVYNTTTVAPICSGTTLGASVNLDNFRISAFGASEYSIQAVRFGALVPLAGNPTQTGAALPVNVLQNDVWENKTAGTINVEYDVVPTLNSCTGVLFTVTVPIQPQPKYDDFTNTTPGICSRDLIGVMLDGRANGGSFVASSYNIVDVQHGALTIAGGTPVWPATAVASNEISNDQWQNTTNLAINVDYSIRPVSAAGCIGDIFHVIVAINPQPDYNDLTDLAGVCSGQQVNINLDDLQKANTIAATQFDITVNPNGLTLASGGPADSPNLPANSLVNDVWTNTTTGDVNVQYDIIPHIGATCVGNPFRIIIAIKPEPVYVDQTIPVCSDSPTNYNLLSAYSAGATATLFDITITPNGLLPKAGSPADGNDLPSTEIVNDVWENLTNATVNVFYDVVPKSADGCVGAPFRVTVQVIPEPDFKNYADDNTPAGICSGDAIGLNLAGLAETTSIAASSYEITSVVTSDPALTRVGGAPPSGTGHPATILMTEAWVNGTATNQTVTYHIIPYNGTCKGDEFTVLVTYVPRPSYADDNTLTSGICADPVGIDLDNLVNPGSPLATKFDIAVNPNGLVMAAGGPMGGLSVDHLAISDDVWTNTTASNVDVEYTILPYNGNCPSLTTFKVTVTIKPQPDYGSTALPVCSDVPFARSLTTLKGFTSATATSFTVAIAEDPQLINTATTPQAEGSTTIPVISDKWQNRQTGDLDVVYTITPFVGTCAGPDFEVRVTIHPEPVYTTPSTPIPVICSEDFVNIDLSTFYTGGATATAFDIDASSVPAGLTNVGATAFTASGDKDVIANDQWRNVTNAAKNIVYTVTPISADGCEGVPFVVTVTVSPQPDYNDFPVANICSGSVIGLDLDDGQGGASVQATTFTVLSITAPQLIAVVPAAPRSFPFDVAAADLATDVWRNLNATSATAVYRVVPKTGTCVGDFFEVTVTVLPEPIYTTYTNTAVGVCSDIPLGVDLTAQQDMSGVAATSFRIAAVDFTGLVASTNANSVPAVITATDLSNDQWINTSPGVLNVDYSIIPLNGVCEGALFHVIVAINPEPVGAVFTKDICSGDAVNVDLQVDVMSLGNNVASSFSWFATVDNPNISGETLVPPGPAGVTPVITEALVNTSSTVQQVEYTVTPTSSATCVGDIFKVTININPKPVLDPVQNVDVCANTAVNYSIKMLPAGLPAGTTLEWADPDGAGPGNASPVGGVTLGAPGTIHITDVFTVAGPVVYHVIPKVAGGTCSGDPVDITVNVQPAAEVEAGMDQTLCTDNGEWFLVDAGIAGAASSAQWFIDSQPALGDGVFNPPAGTIVTDPSTSSFTATVPGVYVLRLETDDPAGVCGAVADFVTITVTPKPVLDVNPPKLICGNEPANYSIALNPAGLPVGTVFEWADPDGPSGIRNATGSPVGGVAMGTPGTLHITDILKNTDPVNADVVYEVTPRVGLCVGAMQQIIITVKPSPSVLFGQGKTICSGESVDMEILLDPPGTPPLTTLSWPDPDGSGPATSKQDIAAGSPGTLHITDVLFNSNPAPSQVFYDVISRGANGCFGDTRRVTITVNPGATAEAGNTQTICSGASVPLTGASIAGAADGTWTVFTNPGDGSVSVTTPTTTPAQVNFTATVGGTYVLRLTSGTPTVGSCNPVFDEVTIIVKAAGDPTCTGSGGPIGCPTDVVADTRSASCNNSDGGVEFIVTPALPPSGDVKIEIDGPVKKTQFASIDGLDFTNLPIGRYAYTIEYGTCSNNGFFDIDRSGTVGDLTVDQIQDPTCFGGTGSAIINAVNQTGNVVEWSADGLTWTSFLAGTRVKDLPNGTNLILVRRSGDACSSATTITIANPVEITATLTPTDATCNNNDGSIVVSNLTGGTGPYTFTMNDTRVNLPANNTFASLTADDYTLVVTDSKACTKTFSPVLVSFPGFVNTTAPVTTAPDCTSGGTNGKVEFTITDGGNFEFAVTSDLQVPPTTYNLLGSSLVSVGNLAFGDYAIWLRPVGSGLKCATKVPVSIRGIYAVSYTATTSDVKCFSEPTAIVLNDIKGAPALPYSYTLTNTSNNSVTTGTISASQALSAFSLTNINPGNYSVLLTQDQSSLVSSCTAGISGGAKALVVDGPEAPLDTLYVDRDISFPDLPSGSAVVGVNPSGLDPYETRLELTNPLYAGQEFASDWTQVPVNPLNLKYEQRYSNLFAGQYTLGVRDGGGCERMYVFILDVDTNIFIPNIFTPNGDASNEVFYIRNLPADSKLLITNRWGKEVYKSSSYQNDWNGGDTVDGMYYYTLTLGSQSYSGWVEILRGQ
ncbi:MAG TPA: PKD-like domain-containing protein [Cyclobacteriaceae bacterium]|nr:PKD-like domain-containing protein [Cyclobacteriaceae bacterium]